MRSANLKYQYSNSAYRKLGYFTWIILGILSIVFYKERAAFMDGAFQLVNLINTGEFSIHHYRFTNPLTQLFAWIGVKSGLSLRAIMMGYSINFIVFHTLIYWLIVRWCKNDFLGLVQVGFFTLFVTQSFYFVTPEFYQGMSLLILWTSILLQPDFKKKNWYYPLLGLLLVPIIFDHALLSAFILFVWIFIGLHDSTFRHKKYVGLLLVTVAIYIVHDLYFTSWYDEARKGHFWRHWNEYYPHFWKIPGHKIFMARCMDTYYLFPFLCGVLLVKYIQASITKNQNIQFPLLKLFLVFGFCFAYLMLNHINDPNTPFLFYSQVNYIGLALPLMIAFCFDILPDISHKKWVIYTIGILLLIRLATITHASKDLQTRHAWMLKSIEDTGSKKVFATGNNVPKKLLLQTWACPEETLLLSSLNGSTNSSSLLIKRSDYKYAAYVDSSNVFLRSHSIQYLEDHNQEYFDLGDSIYVEAKKKVETK